MPLLNPCVSAALAEYFGSEEDADCSILFVRSSGEEPAAEARIVADGEVEPGSSSGDLGPGEALAEPLPAHSFLLRHASAWVRTKLENRRAGALDGAVDCTGHGPPTKRRKTNEPLAGAASSRATTVDQTGLPVIRVPLGGPEEVPSALAAIRFAYTGRVAAGSSVREALELYRQGQYLQVEGCGAACIAAIESMLKADASSSGSGGGCGGSSSGGSTGGSSGFSTRSCPAAQELYTCRSLWPDPAQDSAFAAILSAAKPQLVAHFGDALTALNTPELRRQLLALPAEGLEALLESDNFGTDVEDSVLLLLATWVQQNGDMAGVDAVERLCRLVRLAQLTERFAKVLLPALACARLASQTAGIEGAVGWFPISCTEAIYLINVCTVTGLAGRDREKKRLQEAAGDVHDLKAPWFSTKPRRQCLVAYGGGVLEPLGAPSRQQQQRQCPAFEWSIKQEDLEARLQELQPGSRFYMFGLLDSGLSAVSARGFKWRFSIVYEHGNKAAGLYLYCDLPEEYGLGVASLGGPLAALAQVGARLEVDRWRGGVREVAASMSFDAADYIKVNRGGWGIPEVFPLKLPAADAQGVVRSQQVPSGSSGCLLQGWEDYLCGGKITGRLVILPLI
ncbi:hypothetical protein GPECTOR_47g366 [Gonium pectorale]|uniref:BACK domain-containing protein n=1 Tax=Gonium pectorale TaxID=33097 RepID=A0A150G9R8_GONPE|nr:hypothetical protein GPECTOR_47g366 [Gonium pectorale]|eukprot:KXZ46090.1 hypothetical protein GPECTOR_47g366 [Gonium pectorale]